MSEYTVTLLFVIMFGPVIAMCSTLVWAHELTKQAPKPLTKWQQNWLYIKVMTLNILGFIIVPLVTTILLRKYV